MRFFYNRYVFKLFVAYVGIVYVQVKTKGRKIFYYTDNAFSPLQNDRLHIDEQWSPLVMARKFSQLTENK